MTVEPGPDPERLLRLARAGDGPALGQLLELYRNYLALLARLQIGRRLQGKVGASDVVQEAFLKAHRHFGQFRGDTEGELVGWLRRILLSHLLNLVRHHRGSRRRDLRLERDLAAARFWEWSADTPEARHAIRTMCPSGSEEEKLCRYVIAWTENALDESSATARATGQRLRAELEEMLRSGAPLVAR